MPPRVARGAVYAAFAALVLGCTSTPPRAPGSADTGAADDPIARLSALAERQRSAHPQAAQAGLDIITRRARELGLDSTPEAALATLDDTLAKARKPHETISPPHADHPAAAEAQRLLQQGRAQAAIDRLREAAETDPRDPAAWAALGLTAAVAENRPLARAALIRAFELGDRRPETLRTLAPLAAEAGLDELTITVAAEHLAPAAGSVDARAIAVAEPLIAALDRTGRTRAAAEARLLAARGITHRPSPTNPINRLAPRFLLDAGDRFAALGDLDAAQQAFTTAAQRLADANQDSPAALHTADSRIASLQLARGRPAHAAATLLQSLNNRETAPGPADTAILAAIAEHTNLRSELDAALATLEQRAAERATGTAAARDAAIAYAFARSATAATPEARLERLTAPYAAAPHDDTLLLALLSAARDAPNEQRDAAIARLAETTPWRFIRSVRIALDHLGTHALTTINPDDDAQPATLRAAALAAERARESRPLDPDRTEALLAAHPASLAALAIHIQTLIDTGRGRDADDILIERAATNPGPPERVLIAHFHNERGDPTRAHQQAGAALEAHATDQHDRTPLAIDALRIRARAHLAAGDPEAALADAEAVLDLAPAHEEAHVTRLRILNARDTAPDILEDAARAVFESGPDRRAARFLTARRLQTQNRPLAAARILTDLADAPAPPAYILDALATTLAEAGRAHDAAAWFQNAARNRPHSPDYTAVLIRTLADNGEADQALITARAFNLNWPGEPSTLRAAERAAASLDNGRPHAIDAIRRRLQTAPNTLATAAERALLRAETRSINPAARAFVADTAATNAKPTNNERTLLAQLAETAARSVTRAEPADPDLTLALFDRIDAITGDLPLAARAAQLVLAAAHADPPDPDRLIAIYLRIDAGPRTLDAAAADAAHRLLIRAQDAAQTREQATGRPPNPADTPHAAAAFELLDLATQSPSPPPVDSLAIHLFGATVFNHTPALLTAARRTAEAQSIETVLRVIATRFTNTKPEPGTDPTAQLAKEIAFVIPTEHLDAAEPFYRHALRIDPTDPDANNSLGYRMLEQNTRIDTAARLIEVAHNERPDSAAITDSLGWARYKQGIFRDTENAQGAITLLQRALRLARNPQDPRERPSPTTEAVVADHLADALWRTGQRERAVRFWQQAADVASATLRSENAPPPSSQAAAELNAVIRAATAKLRDAEADREPRTAPVPTRQPTNRENDTPKP